MFATLQARPTDALLGLITAFKNDTRPQKIDVGVGVYRDEQGATPIMRAVKAAEAKLLAIQQSKTYLGLVGEPLFNSAMSDLVLGTVAPTLGERLRCVQTAGGCAALRALSDLIAICKPDATVWVSTPTWINHIPLVSAARLKIAHYPYFNALTQQVDFAAMRDCFKKLGPNDVVLLHGACHNPTGVDLAEKQWDEIALIAQARGFLPFVDLAYQGLGRGMDEDAYAVRRLAQVVPEMLVAVSCSKSFAVYRERAGLAMVLGTNPTESKNMLDHMLTAIRGNYSMPPDHGAACVQMILNDPVLRADWSDELTSMRLRIAQLRKGLADGLNQRLGSQEYSYIADQYGMFSLLGLSKAQVTLLREEFGIYMPDDSRVNIAGLKASQIPTFVQAIAAVSY
jgi:aspartate aminotransferase